MQNSYSNSNRTKTSQSKDDDDDLLIFGYACKLFPHDEKTDFLAEERHLQSWNGDGSLRIDRYDCRLLLMKIDDRPCEDEEELCPTEQMEEEMCDEERYKDMYLDIQTQAQKEAEERKNKAEIAFDYGTASASTSVKEEEDSDSEDEPYLPPSGIKLPVGLATPENLKQSHIIDRTAMFVVSKGPQMEIVIKAKQRNNSAQFGFLEFDNMLYPYYKYISKLIREKKYTPDFSKKKTDQDEPQPVTKKPTNALAAIASQHSDSEEDSDSDCELHPSLFAVKKREPSPDIIDMTKNAAGPRQKPVDDSQVNVIRSDYNIKKSDDMYASLFKSLTGYTEPPPEQKQPPIVKTEEKKPPASSSVVPETFDPDVDIEWQQWWQSFYGYPPPASAPKPMIPPPPDMEPVVCRYAEFVARHGAQAEMSLVGRPDLKLHFMDPNSPFFSYYQHKVRYAQWEMQQELVTAAGSPGPSSEVSLNRKQRRRLQDSQKVGPAPPPGVIDPLSKCDDNSSDLHKTQSCPADLGVLTSVPSPPPRPYVGTGAPVSFSLAPKEDKVLPVAKSILGDDDDPLMELVVGSPGPSKEPELNDIDELFSKPPEPPAIQNNQQLDRKEKARIFMEKLLNEKKNLKAKETEEARIRELESQKMELEQKLAEEEASSATTSKDVTMSKEDEKKVEENSAKTIDLIDQLISSRIDNLLQSTGMALVSPEKTKEDREERKRSKESKRSKHKRKRSRSRSRSRDREYRHRRRSRSRSTERSSRRHRYY